MARSRRKLPAASPGINCCADPRRVAGVGKHFSTVELGGGRPGNESGALDLVRKGFWGATRRAGRKTQDTPRPRRKGEEQDKETAENRHFQPSGSRGSVVIETTPSPINVLGNLPQGDLALAFGRGFGLPMQMRPWVFRSARRYCQRRRTRCCSGPSSLRWNRTARGRSTIQARVPIGTLPASGPGYAATRRRGDSEDFLMLI